LQKAGLFFDHKDIKLPIQLTDNLEAHIKIRDTDWSLEYRHLSSGIRHLLLRLGYLLALYHKRNIESAIALFDEPENSLFPSILYDLIKVYSDTAPNTQFFFATHSPIIAAQFHPDERIILEFNDQGKVEARKGVSPEGDDPNDVLLQDFGLENILGKKGLEKLHRYIELKTLIKNEPDQTQKDQLVKEYLEIGNQYHFGNEAYS
jgi:predicted ATP-dependent endonuclease of OLD family